MGINCSFHGFLVADAERRTSAAGKSWVRLRICVRLDRGTEKYQRNEMARPQSPFDTMTITNRVERSRKCRRQPDPVLRPKAPQEAWGGVAACSVIVLLLRWTRMM
jgi:hypothetical protein